MYEWSELLKLWENEGLTTEQMLGQLLRHGQATDSAHLALYRQVEMLAHTITTLTAQVTAIEARLAKSSAS
ncbi:MAG: hypothetical protein U0350_09560 [Caldilineaceae bacterium]